MKNLGIQLLTGMLIASYLLPMQLTAQNKPSGSETLSQQEKSIVAIASTTAKGDLVSLKPRLNEGLDAGLTVNEIKEVLVHLYAYCGFPRSIRGLITFMEVLDERKASGITDETGPEASTVNEEIDKYERGRLILSELTQTEQLPPVSGYGAFAPVMDRFLKEHLFADIFERDVLAYHQRQLVTISVLSTIGGVEPMLRSHFAICLNVGLTPGQLYDFTNVIHKTIGENEAEAAREILVEVLSNR
jgi:4-carboxymuconolactone decarboxylase